MYVYLVFFGIFWYSLTLETLCRPDLKTELEDSLVHSFNLYPSHFVLLLTLLYIPT